METIGHRVIGVLACLIDCGQNAGAGNSTGVGKIEACAASCNDKFMSLKPVDPSEIVV